MGAIDVGAEAIDRSNAFGYPFTFIGLNNPANDTGIITSIEIWAYADITGLRVGTFYLVSGTTYKCRDSEAIAGTITAGSKVTKTVSIAVVAGDFIGCYYSGGQLDRSLTGYAGVYEVSGEYIDPGDQATYALQSGDAISLKGIGITSVDVTIDVPLATVSSEALAPSMVLDKVISIPLATVNAEALAPSLVRDMIFGIPLALVDSEALAPGIVAGTGVIIAVPLALVEAEAPVPSLSLGVGIDVPLALVTSQALVPRVLHGRTLLAVRNLAAIRNLPSVREENPV